MAATLAATFKIRRNNAGVALALVEVAPSGAECDYAPDHPEFAGMILKSKLEFKDVTILPRVPTQAELDEKAQDDSDRSAIDQALNDERTPAWAKILLRRELKRKA